MFLVLLVVVPTLLFLPSLVRHYRAARVLLTLHGWKAQEVRFVEDELILSTGQRVPARSYGPVGKGGHKTIIVAHGIHKNGHVDPRMIRFASALAAQGYRVVTPRLDSLTRYHIDDSSKDILLAFVDREYRPSHPVSLLGISFAGSLALLAAGHPGHSSKISSVGSIGGYHDLLRTLRFLASGQVETSSGSTTRNAHEYGMIILLLQQLREFDLGADETRLEDVLTLWLHEERGSAAEAAQRLSSERARAIYASVRAGDYSTLRPQVLALLSARTATLRSLSPRGHLRNLPMKVVLIHGSRDDVVPPEETRFAELELKQPGGPEYYALVTPLLSHVDVDPWESPYQTLRLIHAMSQLL